MDYQEFLHSIDRKAYHEGEWSRSRPEANW